MEVRPDRVRPRVAERDEAGSVCEVQEPELGPSGRSGADEAEGEARADRPGRGADIGSVSGLRSSSPFVWVQVLRLPTPKVTTP